jgi:hypothetical protein
VGTTSHQPSLFELVDEGHHPIGVQAEPRPDRALGLTLRVRERTEQAEMAGLDAERLQGS